MTSAEKRTRVAFRTTASGRVGFGHLRRCLTLAGELARRGIESIFWLDGEQQAGELVTQRGFDVHEIDGQEPAATLNLLKGDGLSGVIVDSYALDEQYFSALHPLTPCLVAIDDLAERRLDVDVIVNGSANAARLRYHDSEGCRRLLGPRYTLLRPSFRDQLPRSVRRTVGRVLVTLGGADPTGSTPSVVSDLSAFLPNAILDVVIGPLFQKASAIDELARGSVGRVVLHRAPENPVNLMMAADLAVSAGGQTLYELAACGVPTVAVQVADNQRGQLAALAQMGIVVSAGQCDESGQFVNVGPEAVRLSASVSVRESMSEAGQTLVDGRGAERVAQVLIEHLNCEERNQHAPS